MIKFSNASKLISFLLLFFILSCSTSNLYESFFVGAGENQYFIKPFEMENSDDELLIDFTIRQKQSTEPSTTMNFSLISDIPIVNIDSIQIAGSKKYTVKEIDRLFFEKQGDSYVVRSTCMPDFNAVVDFFRSDDLTITLFYLDIVKSNKDGSKEIDVIKEFHSNSSDKKLRHKIYDNLIQLLLLDMQ